jgi:putative tricarboxylic transport membrane protein
MRKLEMVPALFMIAISLVVILGTSELAVWDGITPGARFFPLFVGGLGLLLAAILLWQQWRGADIGTVDRPDRQSLNRVVLTVVGLVGMAAGAPVIGLVPMLAVFSLFILLVVLRQRVLPSVVTAAVVAIGTYLVFVQMLAVPLPAPFGI